MIEGTLYVDGFMDNPDSLFDTIRDNVDWDRRMLSRLTTSFGVSYDYSGIAYPELPMPIYLADLVNKINASVGFIPNNCLVNYYIDGKSKMGYHSDRTDILSPNTGVVIISLGSTRTLRFKNIKDKDLIVDFTLSSGSLFYMNSEVQDLWLHSIPTCDTDLGRMSLTFRNIIK
jgi:alkylated DNA repair dioxygenase AlkB